MRSLSSAQKRSPHMMELEKAPVQQRRPSTAKNNTFILKIKITLSVIKWNDMGWTHLSLTVSSSHPWSENVGVTKADGQLVHVHQWAKCLSHPEWLLVLNLPSGFTTILPTRNLWPPCGLGTEGSAMTNVSLTGWCQCQNGGYIIWVPTWGWQLFTLSFSLGPGCVGLVLDSTAY